MEYSDMKLFTGIAPADIDTMFTCLQASRKNYDKGSEILHTGNHIESFALVLNGNVSIVQEDYWGNRNILSVLSSGDVFGEAFAALPNSQLNVSVVAETKAEVLFLNFRRILTTCANSCAFHSRMISNLFVILAEKNQSLNEKLTHISQRSTREKILSFLTAQARRSESDIFSIPMDRQQMADYLSVDRSALSSELGKLKKEGLIDFHKNTFKINRNEYRGS